MTPESIRATIASAIAASWATATRVAWPNKDFNAPTDGSPWIRPVIKMGNTAVGEVGTDGVGWRSGVLMNSIFTKPDDGLKNALDLADRFEGMFRRRCLSGVIFDEPNTNPIGVDSSGWHHTMIMINFSTLIGE